mmetsp:Transcript_45512/g.99125  ORF Transcript_45512/g.99125 Transcript_45512/m.99125 type:complete len:321 (+) Transcript_45512:593-1555(+)
MEVLARIVRMQTFVFGMVEDSSIYTKHTANGDHLIHAFVFVCLNQRFGLLRIHWKLRHASTQLRQVALVIQGTECIELLECLDQGLRGRRIHKVEMQQIIDANGLQHEHHVSQVGPLNLWCIVVVQLVLVGPFGEEPEAFARLHAPGTASPLVGGGFGARHHNQRLHSCPRIEGVLLAEARIDHKNNVVNGDGRFRNVGRQHHFSRSRGCGFKDLGLHIGGQIGIDGQHQELTHLSAHASRLEAQQVHRLFDFLLPSEKDQHVTRPLREVNLKHGHDTSVQIVCFRGLGIVDSHRISSSWDIEDRRVVEVFRELLCVQGG